MTTPTVAVTVPLRDGDGNPLVGVRVTARLDRDDAYTVDGQEAILLPTSVPGVTDSSGNAVLNLFPNALAPEGLGTTGSLWVIRARTGTSGTFRKTVQVPNQTCNLADLADVTSAPAALPLAATIRQTLLAGMSTASSAAVTAADSILSAIGKLQAKFVALASPSGSSQIGFQQSGTGAVARSLQDKARELHLSPEDFGAIGDGVSHPLSQRYASLSAAQAVYPHATALTDEIDWCAWRAAVQAIYDAAAADNTLLNQNFAHGRIDCSGRYVFNRTLVIDVLRLDIVGRVDPASGETQRGGSASVTYNGPAGTVDAPVFIFDCYTHTEGGTSLTYAPPGRKAQARGIQVGIHNIGFFGKGGSMVGAPSASGFVSGVRIRQGVYCNLRRCKFGGTLYDGIVFSGPQLFPLVEGCNFYGVHRDCIANWRNTQDFSTTLWIRDNEFGYFGRYAILLDLYGSVEAMPIIRNNSIEGFFASYYTANRAHYVHGAPCGVCVIGAGNLVYADNRVENGTGGSVAALVSDLHIVEGVMVDIADCTMTGVLFTTNKNSAPVSAAFTTYLTANKVCDITDTRNYLVGSAADHRGETDGVRISNVYHLNHINVADGMGLGQNLRHCFSSVAAQGMSFAIASDMIDTGTPKSLRIIPNVTALGSWLTTSSSLKNATTIAQPVRYAPVELRTDNLVIRRDQQDNQNEMMFFGQVVLRVGNPGDKWNGFLGFQINRLISDMSAAEANYLDKPLFHASPVDEAGANFHSGYYETAVIRRRKIRYEYTAAPAVGTWAQGDIAYASNPAAGGFIGWVCVAGGTPGTWKGFGQIEA